MDYRHKPTENWSEIPCTLHAKKALDYKSYERPMAERVIAWFRALAGRGVAVLMGDPGRAYLPQSGLVELARYQVPTSLELEDRTMRETIVWRLMP